MGLYDRTASGKLWSTRNNNSSTSEIDLRREFHDILYGTTSMPQRGHWVVYRHFNLSSLKEGYDEVYKVGPVDENGKRESIFNYTDELIITRQDPVFNSRTDGTMPIGIIDPGSYTFYFEHTFKPKERDQIFDIDWDDHRIKPTNSILDNNYVKKYNILEVFPYRCDNGRIEYWVVNAETDYVTP